MSFDLPTLPEGWRFLPLGDCAVPRSISYGVVQPGAPTPTGMPIIRVNNFADGRLDLSDVMRIAPDVEAKYMRTRLSGGEVLLTLVGTVGQVAEVPLACAGFNVARAVGVIKPAEGIDAKWLAICLRSPLSQHLLNSRANTTVQTTINLKDVRALPIPMPPAAERSQISAIVGALDDRITLLRETNATLEAIAQALFKSWFVDFDPVRAKSQGLAPAGMDEATAALFPGQFEDIAFGSMPAGWSIKAFTDSVRVIGGGTPKTSEPQYWGGDIPWFSVVDAPSRADTFVVATAKCITVLGLQNCSAKLLRPGTTIISARGTVGRLAVVGREMAMNQSCYALQGNAGDAFFTYFTTQGLVAGLKQRSHGSVFDTITRETLASMVVLYPPESLICCFESAVEPVMERIKQNLQQAQTLATLRDTLLPRLISGQLRLPEVEAALA